MHAQASYAKAQQPLLQAGGIYPTRISSTGQSPGDLLEDIFRDVERYKLRDKVIVLKHFDVRDDRRLILLPKHIDDRSSRLGVDVVGQEDVSRSSKGHEPHRPPYLTFEDEGGGYLGECLL